MQLLESNPFCTSLIESQSIGASPALCPDRSKQDTSFGYANTLQNISNMETKEF